MARLGIYRSMNFLLDTNVVSELRKKIPNNSVSQWVSNIAIDSLYISCITLGEIQKGIIKKAKTDIKSSAVLEAWLEKVIEGYVDNTLIIDKDISLKWGEFIALDGANDIDALIAAQASIHDMVLVTRNTKHFTKFPVKILNPFSI